MRDTKKDFILSLVSVILLASLFVGCKENRVQARKFIADNGAFFLDDSMFTIASAELSYARIPREYWNSRMQVLKKMGINTISVRVPWALHEPIEGAFFFEDEYDIREFCRTARENDMLVWLHIGPAVDEHMDMGGLPWWLLKNNKMELSLSDSAFMSRVGRYFRVLGDNISDEFLCNGGAVVMVQIGEPRGILAYDRESLAVLRDSAIAAGFDNTLFTTALFSQDLKRMRVDSLCIALDIDNQTHAMSHFTAIRKLNIHTPSLCYDIDRRCVNYWGREVVTRNWNKTFMRMFEILSSAASFNISSICGGTSFGHIAGAEILDEEYLPYATSYGNGAIINECGLLKSNYSQFASVINGLVADKKNITLEGLEGVNLYAFDDKAVVEVAPLFDNLPQPISSSHPLAMEECGIGYGAMLYSITLPAIQGGEVLSIDGVHDNAQLFINGQPLAAITRENKPSLVALPPIEEGAVLHILVDAMGRVGNIPGYKDYKGIVGHVKLLYSDGRAHELTGWENYPLPADCRYISNENYKNMPDAALPGFYKTTIRKPGDGDFFLNMSTWSRGEVWINGRSLGRFWNKGPQQMLYVPGCWLHDGDNELIIVDWIGPSKPVVSAQELSFGG